MNNSQRSFLTRVVVGYILAFLILRFLEQATPSRMESPPLGLVQLDVTYWIYKLSGLSQLILHHRAGSILFDMLLFAAGFLCFIFPLRRLTMVLFTALLFIYILSFNFAAMHHTHMLTGFMVILFPFWVRTNASLTLAWQGVRYYTCYIYTMAFLWKTIFQHSFFNGQQGIATFKLNLVEYLYHNPSTFMAGWYRLCIRHEWIVNAGWVFIILLEGLMMIGFFTRKMDKILICFPVIVHLATYFFADAFFIELLVLNISLLSQQQLDRLADKISTWSSWRPRRLNLR